MRDHLTSPRIRSTELILRTRFIKQLFFKNYIWSNNLNLKKVFTQKTSYHSSKSSSSFSEKMEAIPSTSKNGKRATKEQAMAEVFANDMLLEKILKRTIRSNLGFPMNRTIFSGTDAESPLLSSRDIANLRQVCKSWNLTIAKLHRKSHNYQPLFHLSLSHENFSGFLAVENGTCMEEREERTLLYNFIDGTRNWGFILDFNARETSVATNIPPFHLSLTPSFFKVANAPVYHSLFNFLQEHATDSMTRFTFNFHRNPFDYIPTAFPDFTFEKLKHVELIIERMAWSFIPLIQKLLESAPNLVTLDLTSSSCIVTHSIPHLSDTIDTIARSRPYSLRLPDSTKKVLLYGTSDSCSCFYRIPVENLIHLETLTLSASSCILRQIEEMFQHLSERLLHFHLIGFSSCVYIFNRNYQVTFAPMPRLEVLTVTMPWEIRPGLWFQYNTHLPQLKDLTIVHHENDETFDRFLDHGKESVTLERCTMIPVRPHIYTENGFRSTCQRIDATKLVVVTEIKACFPNLTSLGIAVNGEYIRSLEFIFEHMRNLKSLALYVESNARFKTTICWDALFTGLSDIACESLLNIDIPGYWDTICLLDDKYPSIRDLKNLEALYLVEISYPSCRAFSFGENASGHGSCDFDEDTLPPKGDHFFSELSFHFSFFRMKKLSTFGCTKGFMPSEGLQKRWLDEKKKQIKNIRSPKPYHLLTAKFSVFDNFWYTD